MSQHALVSGAIRPGEEGGGRAEGREQKANDIDCILYPMQYRYDPGTNDT